MKKTISTIIILFFVLGYMPLTAISQSTILIEELKAQISNKEEEIKKLEEQAAAYKKELESAQSQKNTLKNQISQIEARVKKLQNDISITSVRIESASLKIDELALDISERQNEIDKKKDSIASTMQVLYEYDQASLIEVLLTKTTLSDLMDQIHYLESLQNEIYKNLVAYQELKKEMENRKSETERQRS